MPLSVSFKTDSAMTPDGVMMLPRSHMLKTPLAVETSASPYRFPVICMPTGKLSVVSPVGTEAAGWPEKFKK
jgi:hypothetical protein